MQSLSTWVLLETLSNILAGPGTVYSYHFRDIAVRRKVSIVTGPTDPGMRKSHKQTLIINLNLK